MNIDKIKQSKLTPLIVLILVILVQLTRIIYSFAFLKQDYHPDETWSFGLANSYYEPYIYQDADEIGPTHTGFWFPAEELKNYLTVEPEHRFSYDSVFYNQSKDLHPPLYYLILHTICSFFPGIFSFWFGFIINIVAFIVLQLFLYKLVKIVLDSDIVAILTCTYFGFTSGALCMFVFVRMYALLAMFATISAYFHAKLYKDNDFKKNLPIIFAITLLGALTHHYYLVFAGVLSACFCFYYLITRELKKMIIYAFSLLASVGVSILIFPATIYHAFGRRGKIGKLPFEWQLIMSLNCITGELNGVQFKVGKTPFLTQTACIMLLMLVVILPLCFLFRKERWFHRFIGTVKTLTKKTTDKLKVEIKNINWYSVFLFITSVSVWIVVFNSVSLNGMGAYTDRYLFVIYPSYCLCLACFIIFILKLFFKKSKRIYFLLVCIYLNFIIFSNMTCPCIYLMPVDRSVRNVYKGSDIIYLTVSDNLLTQISKDVLDSNMIFMTKPERFVESVITFSETDEQRSVYLLLDESCLINDDEEDDEVLNDWLQITTYSNNPNRWTRDQFEKIVIQNNPYKKCEYIGRDEIAGYFTSVYRIR